MYALHGAIATGETISRILTRIGDEKELLLSRDQFGATTLHKAVLYQRIDLIRPFVQLLPLALEACDNVSYLKIIYF